jgi:hypothetical protein
MTPFQDLHLSYQHLSPGEQQAAVERELPALVSKGPLHWLSPESPPSGAAERLVLGVAPYSKDDMRLLDLVRQAVLKECSPRRGGRLQPETPGREPPVAPGPLRVEVFSVLACKTHQDFEKYIPGIGKVYQTPVVGYWVDGVLREKCWGAPARALVARLLGLDSL